MSSVAVVGVGGTLGARVAERLGGCAVDLRCPDPRIDRVVPELADAQVVVNLGGPRVRPALRWEDYFREHVGVTSAVVRSMREGAHLVHVSSTAVYGARGETLGSASREAPTLFPMPAYACAKLAAETMARAIAAERKVDVTVLRPSMVYGQDADSALTTIRRLHRQGIALRLVPLRTRQHLVHLDVLLGVIDRVVRESRRRWPGPLLVADPFVLTNADLLRRAGIGIPVLVDVRVAAKAHGALSRALGGSPGGLGALAVLGLDNTFDVDPTWRALGIDPGAFDRRSTFDAYWND